MLLSLPIPKVRASTSEACIKQLNKRWIGTTAYEVNSLKFELKNTINNTHFTEQVSLNPLSK
jgi:hypothetical protein